MYWRGKAQNETDTMTAKSKPSTLFLSSLTSPGSEVIPPPHSHGQTFTHRRQITQWPWNSSSAPLFGPDSVHLCCLAWRWKFPSMSSLRTTKRQSFKKPRSWDLFLIFMLCGINLPNFGCLSLPSNTWNQPFYRGSSFKLGLCFIYLINVKD